MGVLILGVNTLYRLFCFFRLFLMVGKKDARALHVLAHNKYSYCVLAWEPAWLRKRKASFYAVMKPSPALDPSP